MNISDITKIQSTTLASLRGKASGGFIGGGGTFNIQITPGKTMYHQAQEILAADPCAFGHTPAYLTYGGVACYVCGRRLA